MNKKIEEMDITELKALSWDIGAIINQKQQEIQIVNKMIAQKMQRAKVNVKSVNQKGGITPSKVGNVSVEKEKKE